MEKLPFWRLPDLPNKYTVIMYNLSVLYLTTFQGLKKEESIANTVSLSITATLLQEEWLDW